MLHFLRLLISLCASFALLIVGAMVLGGRLHPDWSHDFGQLDVCGDSLCFMGITPGVTSWDDAKKILQPYGYTLTSSIYQWITGATVQVQFNLEKSDTGKVGEFSLDYAPFPHPVTLKAIIARFGVPCLVSLSSETFYVGYPRFAVEVPIFLGQGSPRVGDKFDTPYIEEFRLETDGRDNPTCDAPLEWHGFRSADSYRNHPFNR